MNPSPRSWVAWSLHLAQSLDPCAPIPHHLAQSLSLTSQQHAAARRLLAMAQRAGGALLADAPGLGKSRVGLAAALSHAAERNGPLLICAPSRLLPAWRTLLAMISTNVEVALWSHAQMSRSSPPPLAPATILVDEAHHLRHPHTRRASSLRNSIGGASVFLLSATPLCRQVDDVVALLRLFLHDGWTQDAVGLSLDDALSAHKQGSFELVELLSLVALRRDGDDALVRPSLRLRDVPYDASPSELLLWSSLEASLASLNWSLMGQRWPRSLFIQLARHRWESGPHALASTLSSLVDLHQRALQAHALGLHLGPDAFDDLFAQNPDQEPLPWRWQDVASPSSTSPDLIRQDLDVLSALLDAAQHAAQHGGRLAALIALLRDTPQRWLILSQYEATASALFHALRTHLGPSTSIGLMTGSSAQATGLGNIDPEALLARFSPRARQLPDPPRHQAIQLLIATDCMAEGVDLQDCAHLVLVDLPYAPLVIEQRVGRLVRPHSAHHEVFVYSLRPNQWRESLGTIPRLTQRLLDADRLGVPMRAASAALNLDAHAAAPLEALLARDLLTQRLDAPAQNLAWRFWRVEHGPGSTLCLFARLTSQSGAVGRWCIATPHHVSARLDHALPTLTRLAALDATLTPWRPGGPLWDAATQALEAQRACLHAAAIAPHRLSPGCAQRRAWALLATLTPPLNDRAQACYGRLMRPLSPPLLQSLEDALRVSPQRVLLAVEALPEPIIPQLELLGGLLW